MGRLDNIEGPSGRETLTGCPDCGRNDGALNVGRGYWFVCHLHEVKWFAGYAAFLGPFQQPEEAFLANNQILSRYAHVGPPEPPIDPMPSS